MKLIYIIRHAKSNQSFLGSDYERPLNERGFKDAPNMAKWLKLKVTHIDAFISSPAVRAKTTAISFAKAYNKLSDDVVYISALYHADVNSFYEVVNSLPDELNAIALFSHNPGITNFINNLNTGHIIDNMPTCGIFGIKCYCNQWEDFKNASKEFLFFIQPKLL